MCVHESLCVYVCVYESLCCAPVTSTIHSWETKTYILTSIKYIQTKFLVSPAWQPLHYQGKAKLPEQTPSQVLKHSGPSFPRCYWWKCSSKARAYMVLAVVATGIVIFQELGNLLLTLFMMRLSISCWPWGRLWTPGARLRLLQPAPNQNQEDGQAPRGGVQCIQRYTRSGRRGVWHRTPCL